MTRRAEPVRTCVGCRVKCVKSDLLRVVAVGDSVVPDPRGRMPGRGAHLHPDPDCLALAERRRAFPRALRLAGPLDATAVGQYVAAAAQHSSTATAAQHSQSQQSGTTR